MPEAADPAESLAAARRREYQLQLHLAAIEETFTLLREDLLHLERLQVTLAELLTHLQEDYLTFESMVMRVRRQPELDSLANTPSKPNP